MVTITVSLPSTEQETMSLIETLTQQKGYKLIQIDRVNRVILFEPNRDFGENSTNSSGSMLLCD